jgi:hypothetical protein
MMPNPPETSELRPHRPAAGDLPLSAPSASDITPGPPPRFQTHKHNRFRSGIPLGPASRGLLVLVGLVLLAGFGLSGRLSPDPRGYGTHQQLGLPGCTFQMLTQWPCPSCGGTTAFAHFVRGQWPSAVRANAAAFVLALVCAVLVPWSWASAASGRTIGIDNPERALLILVIAMSGLFALQWGVNLLSNQ